MPFARTEAICLRTIDYSETSQVLRFLSREHGKISCIAKGSKRRRSAFHGTFDLLGVYDLIRIEKQSEALDVLTQSEAVRSFRSLGTDFGRFSAACYVAEFADAFTAEGLVVEGLYATTVETLDRLDRGVPVPDAVFSFEARALRALGLFPRVRECGFCRKKVGPPEAYFAPRDGGAVCLSCRPRDERRFLVRWATLESIARFGDGEMPREPMKERLVDELRRLLDTYVAWQLEKTLRSAAFVRRAMETTSPASPSTRG